MTVGGKTSRGGRWKVDKKQNCRRLVISQSHHTHTPVLLVLIEVLNFYF